METRRETIAHLLEETEYPLTVSEICTTLEIRSKRMVTEDLGHIAKSVKHKGLELLISPARCGKCGFDFRVTQGAKKPSKCPKCRSGWILAPSFIIRRIG